tara:strand:+ start:636 stop:800 length:165 start_codon:yes stop_codon:yes gene_type:complete
MSTFTLKHKVDTTPLDGPNDLKPVVKTSFMVKAEDKKKAAEAAKAKKSTKTTKE